MIFLILGTQKFQFNRLLIEMDRLVKNCIVKDKVFAQIGYSSYLPKNYEYCDFLEQFEFEKKIKESDFVITHAGVGSILSALDMNKKVIMIPRKREYGEHIDDHQCEIANKYSELNYCILCNDVNDLEKAIKKVNIFESSYKPNLSLNNSISDYIVSFIEKGA